MITIIDYGLGNIGSISNMLIKIGVQVKISSFPVEILKATKIILPGVGHFDYAMAKIKESNLKEVLDKKVLEDKVPILGICLGMQLLTKGSEEGVLSGLGWIDAHTKRFNNKGMDIKIPHMGWNKVNKSTDSSITKDFDEDFKFYFVHSYYVKVQKNENSILKSCHGINFDAAIQKDNIYGVQFHPEKSHKYGLKLLENFVKL